MTADAVPQDPVIKAVKNRLKVRRNQDDASKDRPNSDAIKHIFVQSHYKQPNQVIRSRISANKPQEVTLENSAQVINKRVLDHNSNIVRSRIPPSKPQGQVLKITEAYQETEAATSNASGVVASKLDDGIITLANKVLEHAVKSHEIVLENNEAVLNPAADVIQDRIDVVEEQSSVRLRVVELEMFKCHRSCMLSKNSPNASNDSEEDNLLIQQVKAFPFSLLMTKDT